MGHENIPIVTDMIMTGTCKMRAQEKKQSQKSESFAESKNRKIAFDGPSADNFEGLCSLADVRFSDIC